MKPIDTLLLLCVAIGRRQAVFVPENQGAGNRDLVDLVKLNLRTNNDDYTDAPATKFETTTFPSYIEINKLKGLRRANKEGISELFDENLMYELEQNVIGHNFTKNYRKSKLGNWKITPLIGGQKNLNRLPMQSQPKITTQKRAILKSNPSKIEKFQIFFEKNKDLFKEFISSKIAARTQVSGYFTRGGPTPNMKGIRVEKNRKTAHKRGWLDGDESGSTTEPLDPDRLDMLPAVGGRVHYWRIRGRLCHRHVLMPEGPKYDSKGRVYLPAHTDHVHRPFKVTRRPHLLLPKCCNCCKKSVLGCE
ncbi:uncharacterized protein LOC123720823 [Pieris brassicae]|uniref:Uncharacterized protein n=1 Tax=Pieris brassicae TaxID=7116 RepID=A0A9P0TXG3_PIEBR|nr:uncharacterized protein LOC123720823 [Pieris brassicae]CAH4037387.1 unnamed protein product [Pieris brassicae]